MSIDEERQTLHDAVVHGLRHYFSDHGDMKPDDIGSATKRIMGKVFSVYEAAKVAEQPECECDEISNGETCVKCGPSYDQPVSLEECIQAAKRANSGLDYKHSVIVAKAVLDAAGVPYVEE
ncbi:hypothetical protein [Fimbriiglobus ruber]|uniref:hypothetical protein n=1 Tax=Fimbriiglobus ruber TaxID=1908690 RepID=UPI00117B7AEC|nr:hypothetical protein [Fimbriiglobus ruber]